MTVFLMKGVPADSSIQLEEIDSLDSVLSFVEENEEVAIVVVSLSDISNIKKYNAAKKNAQIKIVALCQDSETDKLADHQKKNRGADMYLPGPLTADYLSLVEEVFSISDSPAEKSTSSFAEDPSIKFDLSSIEDELKDHKIEQPDESMEPDSVDDNEASGAELEEQGTLGLDLSEDETKPDFEPDDSSIDEEDLFESPVEDVVNLEESDQNENIQLSNPTEDSLSSTLEESNLVEADVADNKSDELDGLSFETDEDQSLESEQDQELEFEGAPPETSDEDSLCFEVSDEESSLGASMDEDEEEDLGIGDVDEDDLEFDTSETLETTDPDEDALNDLVTKEVTGAKNIDGELDLSGDDDNAGELDLSGDDDSAGELDLSGDDDSADELDLSGDDDSAGELDLSGDDDSAGELDLSGDDDSAGELDLSGDDDSAEELDLSGDAEDDDSSKDELDFSTQEDEGVNESEGEGQLPSQEDLDFPDMPGSTESVSAETSRATDDSTGDIDTTLVGADFSSDTGDGLGNTEFDYKTSMHNQVITSATKTNPTSGQTETVGEENLENLKQVQSNSGPSSPKGEFSSGDLDKIYHQFEVMKAQRDELLKELEKERSHLRKSETEVIQLREEVEELKVENKILKKRHERKDGDYQRQYDVSEEKRRVLEEKLRVLKNKYEESVAERHSINSSNKFTEKSLESKIELMEIDHRSQITAREEKINELRRGNEALEFNLETLTIKNQELLEKKKEIEERLRLVISSLRGSIDLIEEDQSVLLEEIKLNEEMDDQ